MNILETKGVTKRFGGLVAVNDVSLHVEAGEILGLIGPNGAGKTTFQNTVAGLDPPTSGEVYFLGNKVTGFSPQVMCSLGLSRTFQIPRPFPKLTVLENVLVSTVFGNTEPVADKVKHARDKLDFVEFPLGHNVLCETLNTVQLKRLDLARALASSPKLCLLDELASGLSEVELEDIIAIIRKIRDTGVTILMVEHIMQVIMNLCDRLAVISFGNKIAEGPTGEVTKNPKVIEAYLGVEED
ncbi:ABC transporter ATP-binding protein [Desulforhopalus singaporensis]|uniref:Branched-chain amino acid transport system ATP-binding protein n=1 Tax=Desulforhopalus singaporensis TaxID=91360 RepID=A0A1H0KF13_9BACT|nr:ABC transporter ATP-binding protein [Desulforhopalus singaporensis]SDO54341.1 branched-chain amino acid transport system ATP-binding protein [Desulforhopalus singaporensis]